MPRRKNPDQPLTPLELEIMNVLWDAGPANVQSVQARLQSRNLAYTTVQTMLNVLHRKGKVKRVLKDRAYIYRAVLSRPRAVRQAVGEILERFFGGSADSLVLNLIESRQLTPAKLAKIQKMLEAPTEENHGNDQRIGAHLPYQCRVADPCDRFDCGLGRRPDAKWSGSLSSCGLGSGVDRGSCASFLQYFETEAYSVTTRFDSRALA